MKSKSKKSLLFHIYISLAIVSLFSCEKQNRKIERFVFSKTVNTEINRDSLKQITIVPPNLDKVFDGKSNKYLNVDSFIDSVKYIKLESTKNSLIGEISKFKVFDKKIYILDKLSNSIVVFSEQGKFLNKLSKQGKGPGEYDKIYDFDIDRKKKELAILTSPVKIMRYKLTFEFIKDFNVPLYSSQFSILNDSLYAFYLSYGDNTNKMNIEHNIIICDEKGNILNGIFPYESKEVSKYFHKASQYFYEFSNSNYFFIDLNDTIYSIKDRTVRSCYALDFGNKSFVKNILNENIEEQTKYFNRPNYAYLSFINESHEYLLIVFIYNSFYYNCLYNKKSGESMFLSTFSSKYFSPCTISLMENDNFYCILEPMRINNLIKKIEKSKYVPEFKDLVKNTDISDNPIIVNFKLK